MTTIRKKDGTELKRGRKDLLNKSLKDDHKRPNNQPETAGNQL